MLVNIIQSDRFWTDLQNIINIFEPCLYILRLCDRESPAMDQPYFYVRKMDGLLPTLKETLNVTEDKYNRQTGPNLYSKVMNYFLRSKETFDTEILFATLDDHEYDSDDDSSAGDDDENLLEDDMESDDETVDNAEDDTADQRCGTILERAWVHRSKALRTDIAIAGWMCSPHAEIMEDCKTNNKGEHRLAVIRVLRQWYSYQVFI